MLVWSQRAGKSPQRGFQTRCSRAKARSFGFLIMEMYSAHARAPAPTLPPRRRAQPTSRRHTLCPVTVSPRVKARRGRLSAAGLTCKHMFYFLFPIRAHVCAAARLAELFAAPSRGPPKQFSNSQKVLVSMAGRAEMF